MQARMKNPGVVIPDAMTAIRALNEAIKQGGVHPIHSTWYTCEPARSMVAAYASAPRPKPRKTARATSDCSPWSPGGTPPSSPTPNAPYLALTEAVTRLSDQADPVPDAISLRGTGCAVAFRCWADHWRAAE
jgi:hypothetical protein